MSKTLVLKRLAEAYAYIKELREAAIQRGDAFYINSTEGIEEQITRMEKESPRAFKRHYRKALERLDKGTDGKKTTQDKE